MTNTRRVDITAAVVKRIRTMSFLADWHRDEHGNLFGEYGDFVLAVEPAENLPIRPPGWMPFIWTVKLAPDGVIGEVVREGMARTMAAAQTEAIEAADEASYDHDLLTAFEKASVETAYIVSVNSKTRMSM